MSSVPRRRLEELAFMYEREPNRRDVYVEGPFDACIIDWFMRACSVQGVVVYPISAIEISDGELLAAGQKTNNRERVVRLAAFLMETHARRAACVVDADFAALRGERPPRPPLFQTDYACMEMYFFNDASLGKFVSLCCRRRDWPIATIKDSLASVLQELFLYRCANDDLGWQMDWLDKDVCVRLDAWHIHFDRDGFVVRFLNKNSRVKKKAEFLGRVTVLRKQLRPDPRHQINGHDLIALLRWYIRKKGITDARTQIENVLSCMTMTLDHRELGTEPLFHGLCARLA